MRNLILPTLLVICLCAVAISAKPAKKLTPEEIADVNDVMASIEPDKAWIERIMASKCYKDTVKRSKKHAKDLEKFRDKLVKGDVKCKKRINGVWVEAIADVNDVEAATRLDRPWNADPNVIEDILIQERCPLDGHLYRDDFGSDPNDN